MSLLQELPGEEALTPTNCQQFMKHQAQETRRLNEEVGKVQGFVEKQERTVSSVTGAGFFWASSPEPQPTFGKAAVGMLLSEALKSLWVHMFLS